MDSPCRPTSPNQQDQQDGDRADSLTINTTIPRIERAQSIHEEDEGNVVVELSSIMATASNPVSPGPSSPPLDQVRMEDFIPPTRPSSTPFPQPEPRNTDLRCSSCPTGRFPDADNLDHTGSQPLQSPGASTVGMSLNELPAEIHECILDHLFGFRVSAASKSSVARWGTALRHPRRKELSELSLVSRAWRILIQERLYRHIKLRASVESLRDASDYFSAHPHLRSYVKHIEIWFPVFQPRYGSVALSTDTLPTVTRDGLTTASYVLPMDNCSLEEAFRFVAESLPEVCVMTLEGGERKKAPKVRHWTRNSRQQEPRVMPKVHSVRTLICKGQWNLIRGEEDFTTITSALPNLQEWHGSYHKPKSKSYLTMANILTQPLRLTSLDLCIEGDYRRELSVPPFFLKVSNRLHFCSRLAMGAASPSLEHLSYTGRVCRQFFVDLINRIKDPRQTRLRSVDITVKNCCRNFAQWNESGSGIMDGTFIYAFEDLIIAGIRALGKLKSIEYLRIRYVDLGMRPPSPLVYTSTPLHNLILTSE